MNTISCILEKLASDNSRLFKEKILKQEKDNALLKQVFEAAYNPFINYYIRQTPEYIPNGSMMTLVEALDELEKFSSRKLTGNAAVAHYASILRNVDEPEVIEKIIGRDLKVGVGVPTINKIWPGLIPTFEVMLAHQNIDGITFPCYSQCLSGNWKIETDKGVKKIEDIVKNRLNVKVKSFDFSTNSIVFKPVIDWFEQGKRNKLYKINYMLEDGTIHTTNLLTDNHKIWCDSSKSWKEVKDLKVGDLLLFM